MEQTQLSPMTENLIVLRKWLESRSPEIELMLETLLSAFVVNSYLVTPLRASQDRC